MALPSLPPANSQAVQPSTGGTIPFTPQWYAWLASIAAIQVSTTTAGLPSPVGNAGARGFVTDATATTFASVLAGGGANAVPVYSDGTNWRIG